MGNKVSKQINVNDHLSFVDDSNHKHGLRGHVQIIRENKTTKEKTLWYEDDNIIPISGYQWILMKMFNLFFDSPHKIQYEDMGKDSTVVVPDLNNSTSLQIGINPTDYTTMSSDISENHFIQGFMIGNGGSGEDSITTKNSDYSFVKLRNPIPFQQTQTALPVDIAGKYLGMLRVGSSSFSKSYYIKKFDERPHIYHSWYKTGQRWDYVDPVTQNDLGPNAVNGIGKTNRIETYAAVNFSLDEDDCVAYFSHDGSTQAALVNELGLVAYDAVLGVRSIIEKCYEQKVKDLIKLIYNDAREIGANTECVALASDIYTVLSQLTTYGNTNINAFIALMDTLRNTAPASINFNLLKVNLSSDTNISVEGYYNQNNTLIYTTDKFLEYMSTEDFALLTTDEAERIRLITYYTFRSIPLQSNWRVLINYRIYAN